MPVLHLSLLQLAKATLTMLNIASTEFRELILGKFLLVRLFYPLLLLTFLPLPLPLLLLAFGFAFLPFLPFFPACFPLLAFLFPFLPLLAFLPLLTTSSSSGAS